MKVCIYTDGSSMGNPGPGGYGAVLTYEDQKGELHIKEKSQGYAHTTNNRMELMGVISGIESLNRPCQVDVYSDSKYVVDAFNKGWVKTWEKENWRIHKKNPVKNPDLWKYLLKIMKTHEVTFHWVKGHAGHAYNERCDQLATSAAAGEDLIEDIEKTSD